jgi:dimethylamine/trimethylamine dehydrogenase
LASLPVFTPDDVMSGHLPTGHVVIFDDDHYYMGGVIAERLYAAGCQVTFVTRESLVSAFTQYTLEQGRIQKRLLETCSSVRVSTVLSRVEPGRAILGCCYTGRETPVNADALVLVTGTVPVDGLDRGLRTLGADRLLAAGIRHVDRIGDCLGPGTIAAAVYSGHLYARTLTTELGDAVPFRRENVELLWDDPLPGQMIHP